MRGPTGNARKRLVRAVFERDGYRCRLCEQPIPRDAPPNSDWQLALVRRAPGEGPESFELFHRRCASLRHKGEKPLGCPSGKLRYGSAQEASEALEATMLAWVREPKRAIFRREVAFYECDRCPDADGNFGWHLTSRPRKEAI